MLQLTERVYLAAEHVKKMECEAEARIQSEQASVRERIAELEYLWQKRVVQEQTEREQTQEPASNLSPFRVHKLRREMKTQDPHPAEAGRTSADSSHNTGTVAKPREFQKGGQQGRQRIDLSFA